MIQDFVDAVRDSKPELLKQFAESEPTDYAAIVRSVVRVTHDALEAANNFPRPNPNCIHTIDDGEYQGTLVFVIGEDGYQPSTYWYVKVGYGSCSGCDTLQAVACMDEAERQQEYYKLAMDVASTMRLMDEGGVR